MRGMVFLKSFCRFIERAEEFFCASAILLTTVVLFVNVVLRYGFSASTSWAEELIRYLMIWITFIGGCVWNRELKIRFGNAFELWNGARDVTMEGCRCREVYDSCFTHQGPGEESRVPENIVCRGNVFERYGMAAYEARDPVPRGAVFADNVCLDAGLGFSMQDETPPRRSEIWPRPMGHHLFLWRTEHGTAGGYVEVTGNSFGPAPYGGAVYSLISKEAREQFLIKNNRYSAQADRMLADDREDS